jgi:hypothetical protein
MILFISNSYYIRKIDSLQVIPLHPNFYKYEFLLDVKSALNYTEMLKLMGISRMGQIRPITLVMGQIPLTA